MIYKFSLSYYYLVDVVLFCPHHSPFEIDLEDFHTRFLEEDPSGVGSSCLKVLILGLFVS
jgi:hypothetical protein